MRTRRMLVCVAALGLIAGFSYAAHSRSKAVKDLEKVEVSADDVVKISGVNQDVSDECKGRSFSVEGTSNTVKLTGQCQNLKSVRNLESGRCGNRDCDQRQRNSQPGDVGAWREQEASPHCEFRNQQHRIREGEVIRSSDQPFNSDSCLERHMRNFQLNPASRIRKSGWLRQVRVQVGSNGGVRDRIPPVDNALLKSTV